ncbi:hypothetical protein GUJ93_ZPchr0008g12530 [Zizania palustris]|uniref:Uncharacterized protein n=1 Tax=Zizania palustris TaxID=103762 RepID=A0A8J5R5H5_ZIZPA|nr:hypothetical protein GUJ93_ZPchr0008g12530 [Zizania palustris]
MAAMASPTSPSSPFLPAHLLLHRSPSADTMQLAVAAAGAEEEAAGVVHGEFVVAAANALRRGPPRKGKGGQQTNAVLQVKPRGGAPRRPAPPGGAGPREGRGGRGGAVHAVTVAVSGPKRPSSPAEGTGGSGGVVNAASS